MKAVKRLAICHGLLTRVVVSGDAAYTGSPAERICKVRLRDLTVEWALPSERYYVDCVVRDLLLLVRLQWPTSSSRALRADGTVAWTRDDLQGWVIWRDHILCWGSPIAIVDPGTGTVERHVPFPPEDAANVGWVVIGDLLLSATPDLAVLTAYDLVTQRVPWRVSLADRFLAAGLSIDPTETYTLVAGQGGWIVGYCARALFVVSASTGEIPWVKPAWLASSRPVAGDGRVYVSRWKPWDLLGVDQATGATVFTTSLRDCGPEFAIPVNSVYVTIAGDHLITTSKYGVIGVFRRDDGAIVSSGKYRDYLGRAVVAGDRLLVPGGDGLLVVYERPGTI